MRYSNQPKRISNNTNLELTYDSYYRGLPVYTGKGPLIKNYLDRLYNTCMEASALYGKVFAVRVDLHFPITYHPLGEEMLGNEYLTIFKRQLRRKIEQSQYQARKEGKRVHPHGLKLVIAREYDQHERKPHFHLLILLNGHAFNTLGDFHSKGDNLFNRIQESWAEALGLESIDCKGSVYIPKNAQYRLSRGSQADLESLYYRSSYLCKAATKNFNDGCHAFCGTRNSHNDYW